MAAFMLATSFNLGPVYASSGVDSITSIQELPENIAVQYIGVGESFDSIVFPTSINAVLTISQDQIIEETEDLEEIEEVLEEDIEEGLEAEDLAGSDTEETEAPVDDFAEEPEVNQETPIDEISEEESGEAVEATTEEATTEEAPTEEAPINETPVVEAPFDVVTGTETQNTQQTESAPVSEPASTPAAPEVSELAPVEVADPVASIIDFIFPAIEVKAAEVENQDLDADTQEPADEAVENIQEPADKLIRVETVLVDTPISIQVASWELDSSRSTAETFDSSVEGAYFTFVPAFDCSYPINANIPIIKVIVSEEPEKAFEESVNLDGVRITVKADAGVFPDGAILSARRATPSEETLAEDAVAVKENVEDLEEFSVVNTYSFDISILDGQGNEIQPDNSKGQVYVSFAMEEVANEEMTVDVYHMEETSDGSIEADKLNANSTNDTIEVKTTGFSVYTLVVTMNGVGFENNGYPYCKNSSGSNVVLAIKPSQITDSTQYQWQVSTDGKATWSDIQGATQITYTASNPAHGSWYRCKVNGSESKAVEIVRPENDSRTWTNKNGNIYVSNGTMAYNVSGNYFDVAGYYRKNNRDYMLQTVYGGGSWQIATSTSANPSAGASSSGNLEEIEVAFNDSEQYAVIFTFDLAQGQKAVSFGCDTQLGDSSTSGDYADYAALEADKESDNTLNHVAMIGAASSEAASEDDPAFVITPVTKSGLKFWLGCYSSRQHFAYSTNASTIGTGSLGNVTCDGNVVSNIALSCLEVDSGMTMSWSNVEDGGRVQFQFSVGDVKSTGAIGGAVNYTEEKIEGLVPNTTYSITAAGVETVYQIKADSSGKIGLSGTDENSREYDFIGKNLHITGVVDEQPVATDVSVKGRPSPVEADTNGTDDQSSSAVKPADVGSDAIVTGSNAITLNINKNDSTKMGQQYRVYNADGSEIANMGWTSPGSNGKVTFTGLAGNTSYLVKARVPATRNAPASEPSAGITVKTVATIGELTLDETASYTYDGQTKTRGITATEEGVTITYSKDSNENYSAEVPNFADAGVHTIYYKATKDGYRTVYGSYNVTIYKQARENVEIEVVTKIDPDVVSLGNVDLSHYLSVGDILSNPQLTGESRDYINQFYAEGQTIKYSIVDSDGIDGKRGSIVVKVSNPNYEDYYLTIPVEFTHTTKTTNAVVNDSSDGTNNVRTAVATPVPESKDEEEIIPENKETIVEKTKEAESTSSQTQTAPVETEETVSRENIIDKGNIWATISNDTKTKIVEKFGQNGGEIFEANKVLGYNLDSEGTISAVDESEISTDVVPVKEIPVALTFGQGAVVVKMELKDSDKVNAGLADASFVARSLLSKEQISKVAAGSVVEIKVEATPVNPEEVSELDAQVISDGVNTSLQNNPNLTMGNYIDLSMYMKVDEEDWTQITDTTPIEIVIDIPEEYRGISDKYYIMRAHEGQATLLEDLDDNPDTITISTGQFSTYAIMFDQVENASDAGAATADTVVVGSTLLGLNGYIWMILISIALIIIVIVALKSEKEE